MTRRDWLTIGGLCLLAAAVQAVAMAGVAHVRGTATAYAYQSPDAEEYVSYARGIAWQGRYARIDHDGRQVAPWPDTWRTPGYPAVLAVVVGVFGDSTPVLLAFHQVLTLLTVPLLWLILRRFCSPRWALLGAIGWCLDPFRVYYSLWLLAETLFTLVLLLLAWLWFCGPPQYWQPSWGIQLGRRKHEVSLKRPLGPKAWALAVGLLAGFLVLIRPIAIPIPLLVLASLLVCKRPNLCPGSEGRIPFTRRIQMLAVCVLGVTLLVAPWCLRNHRISGHCGLASQGGASLAYHKATDVILWSEGRSRYRFDKDAVAEVRDSIDQELLQLWSARFGPPPITRQHDLHWQKLNYGQTDFVNPFVTSSLLQEITWQILQEHKTAAVQCFAAQGLSMLVFPLGLVLFPPAGVAPLSMLGGGSLLSRVVAGGIGLGYAMLLCGVVWNLVRGLLNRRHMTAAFALVLPAAVLFILSVPSEDPRFRAPLIPLFWGIALARPASVIPREAETVMTGSQS